MCPTDGEKGSIIPREISSLNLFSDQTQISFSHCCQYLHHISNSQSISGYTLLLTLKKKKKRRASSHACPYFKRRNCEDTCVNHSLDSKERSKIFGKSVIRWVGVQETGGRVVKIRVISMTEPSYSTYGMKILGEYSTYQILMRILSVVIRKAMPLTWQIHSCIDSNSFQKLN